MTDGAERLLEREAELARLDAALERLGEESAGGLVVVEGPGGIGKSALLDELRRRARDRGMRTGSARCTELEQPYAFGAVRQLLGPLAAGAAFAGAAVHARPLFDASADAASDELFTRLHGLYWLCVELASEAPLVLLADDMQWADQGSLAFAAFLRGRLADVPILLAVGTRPVASPPPALAELLADPAATVLRPRPLSAAAVGRWAEKLLAASPDTRFVESCRDATGGNPLLLRELLREAVDAGVQPDAAGAARLGDLTPRGVASVVALRLARLPATAQAVARAVAILGDQIDVATTAALAGAGEDEARAAVELLVRADLLRDAEPLAYTHPIVRASVLDDVPAVVRSRRHREAAALLRARGAAAERVAAQLLAAGGAAGPDDVAPLVEAARGAVALGDPAAAAAVLGAALPVVSGEERAELLLELAEAEALAGSGAAVEHLEDALASTAEPERRARAAVQLGRVLNFAGNPERAVDVLEATERELAPGSPAAQAVGGEIIAAAHITRSAARRLAGRLATLEEPAHAPRTTPERFVLAALAFAHAFEPGGRAEEAARLAERALGGGDVATEPVLGGQVAVVSGLVLCGAGRHAQSERLFSEGLAEARASGSATAVAAMCAMRSLPLLRLGRVAAAEADAREALDLGREVRTAGTLGHCALGVGLLAALERGASDAELDELDAHPGLRFDLDVLPASLVLLGRGYIALARGRPEEALERFRACDLPDRNWGRNSPALVPWRSAAALALLAVDDGRAAAAMAGEEVALAEAYGAPWPLGNALRVAALAGPRAGRRERLERAVAVLERAEAPLDLARAEADLGAEIRRAGERSAARDVLSTALARAERCGAERLGRAVREELAALGLRPSREVVEGRALTPSERRVAELAADGLTNREIGQRLFVTEKTVETHLRATYRKLGLRTRRELAAALPG